MRVFTLNEVGRKIPIEIHKERRKKQRKRRRERQKKKANEDRGNDRRRRIQNEIERAVEDRIRSGELVRGTGTVDEGTRGKNGEAQGPGETRGVPVSRKRSLGHATHERGTPHKKVKTTGSPLNEIGQGNLAASSTVLGAGSFGICYLATYRGMDVVSKNFLVKKRRGETQDQAKARVREELLYEARIVKKLGDHPGIPLVFGVCTKQEPFRLVMQFHGDRKELKSVTIHRALCEKTITDKRAWIDIVRKLTKAVMHVHRTGFLHNDIKSNNVILDTVTSKIFNPVLIDFGKCLPLTGLKGPKILSREEQRKYMEEYPHIAPEIVTGKRGQSIKSDIFSFARVVKSIFSKAKLGPLPEKITCALHVDPEKRPDLTDILNAII